MLYKNKQKNGLQRKKNFFIFDVGADLTTYARQSWR
jgi:hypothetical protein